MKKYQIFEVFSSDDTALGKAPSDINQIAEKAGFESLRLVRVCAGKKDALSGFAGSCTTASAGRSSTSRLNLILSSFSKLHPGTTSCSGKKPWPS